MAQEDDDADEERAEVLNLCSCLDGVVGQLQKQMKTLQSYQRQPQETAENSWVVQSKIVDMYDMCAYVHVDKASLALTQERRHSLAKINKAALSTPVGYMCSFCPKVIAQIKLHIRV